MKVAIHHIEKGFSERWLSYCQENKVDYLLVDLRNTDIIRQLKAESVTHLMCHVPNEDSQLIDITNGVYSAAETMGIKTFPSPKERWHFDNKIFQKYFFESIGAPFVKTEVFYNQEEAVKYAETLNFPIVCKLKRGAGSVNVSLLNNLEETKAYVNKLFTKGVNPTPKITENLKDKINYSKQFKNPAVFVKKAANYINRINQERKTADVEKSYVLFQEFLPDNNFDTRIVIINDIAFGLRRINRENDFRASGSGKIDYSVDKIDKKMIEIAFNVSERCGFSIMGYDFLYNKNQEPILVEMCYGFTAKVYDSCEGFWTKDMQFHKETFSPHKLFIKQFLNS